MTGFYWEKVRLKILSYEEKRQQFERVGFHCVELNPQEARVTALAPDETIMLISAPLQ